MNLKILLFIFILIPLAGASSYTLVQNQVFDYHFICLDQSNNYCSTGTQVLINLWYPNGTQYYTNASMTGNPTYFNITLPTNVAGDKYTALIFSPTAVNTSTEFSYDVTPQGDSDNGSIWLVLVPIIFFSILFFGIALVVQMGIFKVLFLSLSVICAFVGVSFTVNIIENYYSTATSISPLVVFFFQAIVWFLWGVTIFAVCASFYFALKIFKFKRGLTD